MGESGDCLVSCIQMTCVASPRKSVVGFFVQVCMRRGLKEHGDGAEWRGEIRV